ncbi:MAG: ferrochelatase [Raoultibacter sp.]
MCSVDGKEGICGVLLTNTGTPAKPTPHAVRDYLSCFLMDKHVVSMNHFVWWFILHLAILPKRGRASAKKYAHIWTEEGSPFLVAHDKLAHGLAAALREDTTLGPIEVRVGMNYGKPSIVGALRELKAAGCTRLVVLPLYPQSACSTTAASIDQVRKSLKRIRWRIPTDFIENYHVHPTYVKAIAAAARHAGFDPYSDDQLLLSFHSIPLEHIEAGDTYELQVGETALAITGELELERKRWTLGYQSPFGDPRKWLQPFSIDILERWGEAGVANVYFVCPGFSVDCLETLYDIEAELEPAYKNAFRTDEQEKQQGRFVYVPCLDKTKAHVKVLADIVRPHIEGV